MYYHILTEQRSHYIVDDNMNLSQAQWASHKEYGLPSGKWKLKGLHEVRAFNHLGPLINIKKLVDAEVPLTFKNGKGIYVIEDLDHGSARTWTDRVISIWATETSPYKKGE